MKIRKRWLRNGTNEISDKKKPDCVFLQLLLSRHPWLASHGFVIIRPDMRGSGDSEGLLFDEYVQQEQVK